MMKQRLTLYNIILFFVLTMIGVNAFASHVPGGNISYEYVGNNQYIVTLTLYEDCGTAFITNSSESIDISNSCGLGGSTTASLTNHIYQQEISQLCGSQISQSECNGGNLPGIYMHVWSDTVTLLGVCDSWVFSYSSCCRNSSNNLTGSSDDYYFEATLNSATSPTNSSPFITNQPIPYVCANQLATYNMGAYEPDGNTLVYSLVDALQDATTIVSYSGGYTGASPINGISINSTTGEVSFTPTTIGNYVVAILIQEYDDNGNLVGTFRQDFQFEVINCSGNAAPSPPANGISNFSGTGLQTSNTAIQMCEGDNVCFDIVFTDANSTDSIYLESNVATAFPGATFTQTSFFSPASATICLTANPGSNPFTSISVSARDNACPVFGQASMIVEATVVSSTYAGPDQIMCLGAGAQLHATGGSVFNWNVITGDPITGTNFSCNPCDSPTANPATTTTYEVVSDLSAGCNNRDTVTITVVPDFTYTLTQGASTSCISSPIQMEVTPTATGNYTYLWTPNANLDNDAISNPTVTPVSSGNYEYFVEITSNQGCVKHDSVQFTVISEVAPVVTVSTNTTTPDCGDTVFFDLDLGGGIPAMCGPSANTACSGGTTDVLGTNDGENTSTSYPAPFGNWYKNAKHQFLYTATELNAMGFSGGKITQISFEVTNLNGSTTQYNSYSISMGCTGTTSLSSWETGLTEVFSPQNVTIGMGWNDFVFNTAYEWDGVSNLVIQVCFNNIGQSYTDNASTPYTNTSFTSALYYRSDGTPACPYTGSPSTATKRPVTKFVHCPTTPDPTAYSYVWTPTGDVHQGANPLQFYALPATTVDYRVVVTNIAGGCADSADMHVVAHCLKPLPTITSPTCDGYDDGQVVVNIIGNDGPQWIVDLMTPSGSVLETQTTMLDSVVFDTLTAGQYLIHLTDTLGITADTLITITEPSPVNLTVANDTIICIGGTAQLYGSVSGGNGVNAYVYYWSGNGLGNSDHESVVLQNDSVFDVYVLDSLGCSSDTLDIAISIFPPILVTTNIVDTVCPGLPATLTASANGGHGGAYNYNWFDVNGQAVGTGSSLTVTPTNAPTLYYVEVTDDCTTPMKKDSVFIFWYNEPQVDFTVDIDSGCYPVQVTFNNLTPTNQVGTLQWSFGDGATANSNNPVHVYTLPGDYDVQLTVTSPDGCVADTTKVNMIRIFDYPTADYSATPNPTNIFESTVEFQNESSTDAVSFEWFFNDSTLIGTSVLENPEFEFSSQAPFVYPVELVVTNQHGCTDTIIKDIVVNGVYTFYVPTAFTPNDDGINDFFFVKGEGVEQTEYNLTIFDRDGHVAFTTTSFSEKWDGTRLGKELPQDVYVWRIKTKDKYTGDFHEYFGYVTILR